jgi:hypothetical protein
MLRRFHRLARPFSLLALLLLLAPAPVSATGKTAGHDDAAMPCCMTHDDGSSGIKADCCAVRQQEPDASRPAGTAPGTRTADSRSVAAAAAAVPAGVLPALPRLRDARDIAAAPPPHRLHLRLSVIRC